MFNHRGTFTRELFDRHDDFAKIVVHSLVKQMGYEVTDTAEAYGSHDFVMTKEEKPYKVGVEQKMGWKQDLFPYSTLSVSHRKHTSKADLFFEVNSKGTAVAMCPMSVVLSSPVIRKNTSLGTVNEPFYSIPISNLRFFYLEDGVWMEDE